MRYRAILEARSLIAALLLLLTSPAPILAADGPAIRGSSVALGADGTITFQFEGDETGEFEVQSGGWLEEAVVWETEPGAGIRGIAPGLFETVIPGPREGRTLFYRILATQSAMGALFINEVMSKNTGTIMDAEGAYWDWVEIYNPNDTAIELRGYGLSDDPTRPRRWRFPEMFIQPGGFVLVFASGLDRSETGQELHTSFKLNSGGEPLLLVAPDGRIVDQVQLPPLEADRSMGRLPDGSDTWHVYANELTTPGEPNLVMTLGPLIEPPRFSLEEQFFPASAVVTLELQTAPDRVIRYTTDGSPVRGGSPIYSEALVLERTTVVRAIASDGERSSAEAKRTFFLGANHELPVISLASPPSYFEFRDGFLYGLGGSVLSSSGQVLQNYPYSGSHAWKDREIEVSLEFFEPDRRIGFQHNAGLKIFGGWGSRGYPQKSFALFARQKYGQGKIKHRVFPDKELKEFESLVLRNSGNDNQSTHQTPPRPPITEFGATRAYGSYFVNSSFTLMRDAMMQRLLEELDLDTQGYRPAVVYINGDYWGIYNIREKMNEHYVADNHGYNRGEIDLIEGYGSVRAGDATAYRSMRDFIGSRDLRDPENYAQVERRYLELENFIDYHLAVIYFQNFDIGNIKCWRPRVPNGKFRWLVYDQDYGFNLWKPEVYLPAMARDYGDYENMFAFHTAAAGTGNGWPNEGGRTLLLRRMLANEDFKERFIRRCADLLNESFQEDRVAATIDEMAAVIRPEIGRHLERWSWNQLQARGFGPPHQSEFEPFTRETWEKNIQVLVDFARHRPAKLRQDCIDHFGLRDGLAEVTVNVSPAGAGRVQLESLVLAQFPWSGIYFRDYPLALTAIPQPGYRFAGWTSGGTTVDQARWDAALSGATAIFTARFEPVQTISPSPSF
jgi:hypothetical protein